MLGAQAQVALRRGHDAAAEALRDLFQELLLDESALRRVGALMAGTDIRYPPADPNAHPLTGTFAPDLVAELMQAARPLFLDLADRPDLREIAAPWQPRVEIRMAENAERPADAILIRPDAYIAWAGTSDDPAGLREALFAWFGTP